MRAIMVAFDYAASRLRSGCVIVWIVECGIYDVKSFSRWCCA